MNVSYLIVVADKAARDESHFLVFAVLVRLIRRATAHAGRLITHDDREMKKELGEKGVGEKVC
jgi:hypothetical protein